MRLATLRTGDGTVAAVAAGGDWVLLPQRDVGALLASPTGVAAARAAGPDGPAGAPLPPLAPGVTFGPVVPRPAKVVCCGHNYAGHIREMGRDLPRHPTLFTKYADTLAGAHDTVTVPAWAERLDWEAELAAVVGAPLHRASRAEAAAAIAGYTAANDLSVRSWQQHTGQWLPGKAFDATTPLGPVLVTADALDPAAGLELTCRVNGEIVQRGSTADLVFDAAALVAYVSAFTRLRPGDVVLTGTPAGVGAGRIPPRFLDDGDVVETELAGVGVLTTPIRIDRTDPFPGTAGPGRVVEVAHE
ncbi:fumarylacetoacetate hydrolase family protein [Pseudonocardia sp. C8]|uniref:fumarylacetoacetate hydrolase family protein n=1 Tax=Pseudonocardia sp. C8 TaxID=2762759 RepID=UPI00164287CD|nr:fumarylacetoacetate hydrolase family protein [Pseudonocardia sp. C8]MBC3191162.1 fumarylacetoacetate hydrolase family protein [Pseudonocardia sp. C8]